MKGVNKIKHIALYSVFTAFAVLLFGCGYVVETNLLTLGPAYTDWWNEAWSSRRRLTFGNGAQAEDLAEFPVLVRLNSSRIDYGRVQNGGEDLRFIDADGSELSYEIEHWDEGGESIVWVKVPQIDGLSNSDYIWMYYGNDSISDGQDVHGVWDTNFLMVWHLNDQPTGTPGDIPNSANNPGT